MTRRMILAVAALAFVTSASIALGAEEDKPKKRPGGGDLFSQIEKLDLSADQKEKVAAIKADLEKAMAAAREAKDRDAAREAFGAARKALMETLTDAQKEQLRKLAGEGKKRGEDSDKKRPERKKPADE